MRHVNAQLGQLLYYEVSRRATLSADVSEEGTRKDWKTELDV